MRICVLTISQTKPGQSTKVILITYDLFIYKDIKSTLLIRFVKKVIKIATH
jgi:hypothetical protein